MKPEDDDLSIEELEELAEDGKVLEDDSEPEEIDII